MWNGNAEKTEHRRSDGCKLQVEDHICPSRGQWEIALPMSFMLSDFAFIFFYHSGQSSKDWLNWQLTWATSYSAKPGIHHLPGQQNSSLLKPEKHFTHKQQWWNQDQHILVESNQVESFFFSLFSVNRIKQPVTRDIRDLLPTSSYRCSATVTCSLWLTWRSISHFSATWNL